MDTIAVKTVEMRTISSDEKVQPKKASAPLCLCTTKLPVFKVEVRRHSRAAGQYPVCLSHGIPAVETWQFT